MANSVVEAILAKTTDPHTRLALLMGSRLESGWNAQSVGDNNTSFGPFQIHLPAHPGVTVANAEDPTWAVNYMFGEYSSGVAQVPASLWSSDPAQAAATAAYHAERPAVMYPAHTQGGGGYADVWSQVQSAAGGDISGGGGVAAGGPDQTTTVLNDPTGILDAIKGVGTALSSFGASFQELPKVFDLLLKLQDPATWVRAAAGALGVVFLFIGVFLLGREVIA